MTLFASDDHWTSHCTAEKGHLVCSLCQNASLSQRGHGGAGTANGRICRSRSQRSLPGSCNERHQGEQQGQDICLKKCSISLLSKISDPPQFARPTLAKSLLTSVCHKCLVILQGLGEQTIGKKHFQEALKLVLPSCLRSSLGRTELSPVSWEQIGGLEEVKLKLQQVKV